ncbi:MAG: YgiQ family radical SAM protein [Clostridiales bacterium]|nr:YgiQ family radical SAM protein [Clostridiales bacterium]
MNNFLPVSKKDLNIMGIDELDFVYVIGDAYVDHPSFGHAIISRVLEHNGYTVGIIPQPDWHSCEPFKRLGRPRLGFIVMSGNIDPMVNHYTSAKKIRNTDLYSPGGKAGCRPDRADIVYCNRIREAYGDIPIIIGGIEASLRRFAHYDYWSNKVRRSILIDSGADLLIFGMGERQIVEVAELLNAGVPIREIKSVTGTMYIESDEAALPYDGIILPGYDEVVSDKRKYADATRIEYEEQDAVRGKPLIQLDRDRYTVQNPPAAPLSTQELDDVYALPYTRTYHPIYKKQGGVPALQEVEFSITSCRGCYGGCNFCALTYHQGRTVTARSHESIIEEAKLLTTLKNFKGYIHDVGGPTANFRSAACKEQLKRGVCKTRQCLFPKPCRNLIVDHSDYLELLKKLRSLPKIKKVFVRSGIRYDYLIYDKDDSFFYELVNHHVSGQLKVAPEHISDNVLKYMGKPGIDVYSKFCRKYEKVNKELNKNQFLVPYLMSSHPGSTLGDAVKLAEYLRDTGHNPEQVQDFYPTPGSISTCMYYTGIDPRTMEGVYVPRSYEEKQMQRALLQYRNPKNYNIVLKALKKAGREDLIGYDDKCLICPPKSNKTSGNNKSNKQKRYK